MEYIRHWLSNYQFIMKGALCGENNNFLKDEPLHFPKLGRKLLAWHRMENSSFAITPLIPEKQADVPQQAECWESNPSRPQAGHTFLQVYKAQSEEKWMIQAVTLRNCKEN